MSSGCAQCERLQEIIIQGAISASENKASAILARWGNAPIPRCDTCKWWGGMSDERGRCCNSELRCGTPGGLNYTDWDFGCVQWESKDGGT